MSELHELTLTSACKRIKSGELSSLDVTRHTLARIEALQGELHPYAMVLRERALERAEALWSLVTEPPATAELRADVAEVYLLALGGDDAERAAEVRRLGAAACRALESTDGTPSCGVLLDTVRAGD